CIIFFLVLFFYGHRHHRVLHSFPTRRSSDLILYAEADGHYTDVHTDKHKYTLRGNLKSIHESVLDNPVFKRVHKSFLVNTARVHKVLKHEMVLENGKVIPLGKTSSAK